MRTKSKRLALASAAALCLAALSIWMGASATASAPKTVGIAPTGRTTQEFLARAHQQVATFTEFGYYTHVAGLPDAALFSDPTQRDEAHARFTFHTTHTLLGRSVMDTLFVLTLSGPTTVYFTANPSRSATDDAAFATGTKIATYATRGHDILSVQAPNQGIATGSEMLTQTQAGTFTLGGRQYRFGQVGFMQHLAATGEGTRSSTDPLVSDIVLAGEVSATS
jgi:hypothetical protein